MKRFIEWLKSKSYKSITIKREDGNPYLTRYYLIGKRESWFGLYLHHFHRADDDKDLHNHPWLFGVAFILSGYYIEQKLNGNLHKKVRSIVNFLWGPAFHRVAELGTSEPVYTLFFRGPRRRKWGFLRSKDGGVVFQEFIEPTANDGV